MSQAVLHAPGVAGERFRWAPLTLCAIAMFVEGYDAQSIGYVVPVITRQWGLGQGALAPALSAGLFGLMLGALFIAPLADALGRKRVITGCILAFGALTLATAWAETLPALTLLRFLTGLGIGGAMPNAIALTAEFSPPAKRASSVAIMFCFFALGSAFGGWLAAGLMAAHGWQSVFVAGGLGALVVVPPIQFGLPESLSVAPGKRQRLPVARLFKDGRARVTALLWLIFFANLMDLYLLTSWLPTTITAQGISVATAAVATSLVQVGGILGSLVLGPATDRYGPRVVLPLSFLFAAACIAAIGLAGASVPLTMATVLGAGFGVIGSQSTGNGVAAKFYPEAIRATGVGWALGIGRAGSIIGPAVGGFLLATHVDIRTIFLFSAGPPLISALAYLFIGRLPAGEGEA